MYSDYNFFPVLEGVKKQVIQIYEKIKKDSRHHSIIQILGKDISNDSYDSYRACIIKEEEKGDHYLPEQYLEPLKGMDRKVRQVVENILTVFIDTRPWKAYSAAMSALIWFRGLISCHSNPSVRNIPLKIFLLLSNAAGFMPVILYRRVFEETESFPLGRDHE